jgi:hypothetical protein
MNQNFRPDFVRPYAVRVRKALPKRQNILRAQSGMATRCRDSFRTVNGVAALQADAFVPIRPDTGQNAAEDGIGQTVRP